ncbi:MAG: iron ABC transporter permease [Rhodocyclaceae bacterium]
MRSASLFWLAMPTLVLAALCVVHLSSGAVPIGLTQVVSAFLRFDPDNYDHVIVIYQRLTRLSVALYAGASLGVAGFLLQKIMQNWLVSPSTLGINAGATNFVVLAVFLLGWHGADLFLPALAGGLTAMGLTFLLGQMLQGQGDARLTIVLAGAMVGTLFSSATAFVIALEPDSFANLIGWLVGDIGNFDYQELASMGPLGLAALLAAVIGSRAVDVLSLGKEQASALGANVPVIYGGALLTAIALTVSAVTIVGPIGFVGLIMPHVARLLVGETGRRPLWLCLTGGAGILAAADGLARTVMAPRVLNVGTVMSLTGGVIFLVLLLSVMRKS